MIADLLSEWQRSGADRRIAADAAAGSLPAQAILAWYDRFCADPTPETAQALRDAYRQWQALQGFTAMAADRPTRTNGQDADPLARLRQLVRAESARR